MTIRELRILPPLAVGRLGAAPTPVDNYDVEVDPSRPLGSRRLVPASTFEIDPHSGEIARAFVPDELRFSQDGKARPVAPFLEVWALTDEGRLEPLTTELLSRCGASPADIHWRVHLANHKLYRRTGAGADKIEAQLELADHERHAVKATSENFWAGKHLALGHVQYIKPTPEFPEIRLRYTPAGGYVYGSSKKPPGQGPPEDPNIVEILYDANKGDWLGYFDPPQGAPELTNPAQIYAGKQVGPNWVSKGYLDDECDGLVYATLTLEGRKLTAYARVGAGAPAYAPDGFPLRTVADELEQAIEGHEVDPEHVTAEEIAAVEEIVRRAFETVRLMNTVVMNGNTVDGQVNVASTMVRQDTGDTGRYFEPIMARSIVDTVALENLHQNLLVALRSGTAPWFADVLRDHDEIGDLSAKGRRKMPAMMRGADGRYLTLTRRQASIIRAVARRAVSPSGQGPEPGEDTESDQGPEGSEGSERSEGPQESEAARP
jgi:hypothetical protein